jgi:hypothetical protein
MTKMHGVNSVKLIKVRLTYRSLGKDTAPRASQCETINQKGAEKSKWEETGYKGKVFRNIKWKSWIGEKVRNSRPVSWRGKKRDRGRTAT